MAKIIDWALNITDQMKSSTPRFYKFDGIGDLAYESCGWDKAIDHTHGSGVHDVISLPDTLRARGK